MIGLIVSLNSQREAWNRNDTKLPQAVPSSLAWTVELFFISLLLGHLNSLCNPIIYIVRDCQIKEQLYRLFKINKLDVSLRWSKVSAATAITLSSNNLIHSNHRLFMNGLETVRAIGSK